MNPLLEAAERSGQSRRAFLRNLLFSAGSLATASWLSACRNSSSSSAVGVLRSRLANIGPLQAPDENGVQLPAGFSSRVVAVFNEPPIPDNPGFLWHSDPDGGAVFRTDDSGWIYVSNSEVRDSTTGGAAGLPGTSREHVESLGLLRGGVSALRFDASGNLVDAYPVQRNTTTNCSGGVTPWGTWVNGEEILDGYMFECSPLRDGGEPLRLDRFGRKAHEMVALDPEGRAIYHTEDMAGDERFYRTIFESASSWPAGDRPDWQQGLLQVLAVDAGIEAARLGPVPIRWINAIDDGRPQSEVYLDDATIFEGNEGCWFHSGFVFFSTKSDDNIWAIDTIGNTIESIYNPADGPVGSPVDPEEPPLAGVDNITMTLDGEMVVVEDGGDMRAMVLLPDRSTIPLLRLPGDPNVTEVTGPAFSPDGRRLYVASQRALRNGLPAGFGTGGVVYEISLPFAVRVDPPLAGYML
ncbi:alkaline phosphatase PhoX [Spongiibacter sp.]|uniref:alkaline phosphatase PhoX n=1 Tax=Spongiibacter sp. TaxID=2024860 RepID=UPI00356755E5